MCNNSTLQSSHIYVASINHMLTMITTHARAFSYTENHTEVSKVSLSSHRFLGEGKNEVFSCTKPIRTKSGGGGGGRETGNTRWRRKWNDAQHFCCYVRTGCLGRWWGLSNQNTPNPGTAGKPGLLVTLAQIKPLACDNTGAGTKGPTGRGR